MKQNNPNYRILLLLLFFPCILLAQTSLSGKVLDANGETVPFVNVIEKGTSNGTTTDVDGNFTISVPSLPSVLVFSSLGFETQEFNATNGNAISITLADSAEALDEVVVTGLASSIKRSNAANAVGSVTSEELVGTTSQSTVDGALYGKVTGVNITSSSGAPGGGFALRLRGITSITGNNQPLIVIDGVYVNNVEIPSGLRFASGANSGNEENSGNRLADLDPNDIANIEILKGSSAAAIYGQRGSAGVIIITTKRGKQGKTKISFRQDVGINKIQNALGLRPWTAASVLETFGQDELDKYNATIAERGSLYDYEDIIYGETGFITETALSASGGNDKTKFYVGGSYRDEEGIIKNTGFDRFSIRGNIDHKISNVFDISSSTNYIRSNSNRSFTGNENEGGLSYGYTLAFSRPWNNFFPDENGNYPDNPNASGNPLFVRDKAKNEDTNNRIIQSLTLNTKLFTNDNNRIKFSNSVGIDYLSNETFVYVPETHQAQQGLGASAGFIAQGKNSFTQFNTQSAFVWDHDALDGDLALTSQVGLAYLYQESNLVNARGTGLAAGQTNVTLSANQTTAQGLSEQKEVGYFGQVEGNYKDQFIGTLGYRFDKSTLNGGPNKLYGFPKASLAINLANFDFWSLEAVNLVKLRAAYGETGNSANFGSTFTSLAASNIGGTIGQSVDGIKGDPDIIPETAKEFEFGLDLGVINNRINFEATYYVKTVEDLILPRSTESSSGFVRETTNLGELQNKGIELAINAGIVESENFSWNTRVQFYKNTSEITRLDVPPFALGGAGFGLGLGTIYIEEGQPVTQLVGNIDRNGDGVSVPTQVGNTEPDFQMGFSNNLTLFKNLDISFLFQLKSGGENLNLSRYLSDLGQVTADLETQAGQDRLLTPTNADRFVEPAGYLKLREAAMYYRLKSSAIKTIFGDTVEAVKLGVSGRNLFTITDYSSYDPEVSVNGGSGLSSGIEVAPFPSSRQIFFHLNVNF
ncbi:SusC/RagA family TonB-linked outer membrane protein [Cochleicola gelatinilyticus]|uniref:SusC/RagA family TonB-linked outer membrane protein n=1 Tax=Cochleicola gelatinilyticus TaxID=1763537 RepID=A0A167JA46_9FLAO|nr:SusC/RagA family TonB-linked outer membrane protein [Cochleicola gelatinilyticus]OAB80475.1 SusC/RagA family TonB-linked outer membrane protein [Cochleicola gelatinilyticus]